MSCTMNWMRRKESSFIAFMNKKDDDTNNKVDDNNNDDWSNSNNTDAVLILTWIFPNPDVQQELWLTGILFKITSTWVYLYFVWWY